MVTVRTYKEVVTSEPLNAGVEILCTNKASKAGNF